MALLRSSFPLDDDVLVSEACVEDRPRHSNAGVEGDGEVHEEVGYADVNGGVGMLGIGFALELVKSLVTSSILSFLFPVESMNSLVTPSF